MDELLHEDILFSEVSVIAGILASGGRKLDDVTLTGADFQDIRYGEIFDIMRAMQASGKPIDPASVGGEVTKYARLVWEVQDQVPHTVNTGYHAERVHEAAVRRRVGEAGEHIAGWAGRMELAQLADMARKELDEALGLQKRRIQFLQDTIGETINSIGQVAPTYPTPWKGLSDTIGGFRKGALYVIGARPGVGKTSASIQIALELSQFGNVAYSSLEMPERELHLRCMSAGAWIPHSMLEAPKPLADWAAMKLGKWVRDVPKRIAFDDRGTVTVNDIRAHARSVAREGQLAGVVVDYLQLITGTDGAKRLEVVTEASRQLKLLARDLDCPVIALSQLNRNSESRMDKRPALSDLRESGSIEQDADCVFLLHRDMEPKQGPTTDMELLVAKNRHGPTRALDMQWHPEFMAMRD